MYFGVKYSIMTASEEKQAIINLVCNLLKLNHIRCTVFNNSNPLAHDTSMQSRILFCGDDHEALNTALQQLGAKVLFNARGASRRLLGGGNADYKFRNYKLFIRNANPALARTDDDFEYNRQITFVEELS